MKKFRFIDHTGDLAIEVFGKNLTDLFRNLGEAFTEIITDPKTVRARESRHISLKADQIEDLLVRWLNELIFLFDTQGFLFKGFDVTLTEYGSLKATGEGEPYDENRHSIKTTVKGATYHQLELIQDDGMWKGRVILDL